MNIISRIRVCLYAAVALLLAALLVFGEDGLLSSSGLRKLPLFRVPDRDRVEYQNDAAEDASVTAPTETPLGDGENDDFDAALRGLSSDDAAGEGDAASLAAKVGPTSTPRLENTPREEVSKDDDSNSGDDARDIFSGISTVPPNPFDGTGVLGGVVVRSGGLGTPLPLNTPATTPTNLRPWREGQARGYTMLYAMQPEARAVVEAQVSALLAARVREPYIGVLIDGSFGRDFTYLKEIIGRLSTDERALTLVLYLSNGPHMRKGRDSFSEALFAKIDPIEFRSRIRREALLQNQFQAEAVQAREIFKHSLSVNPANSNIAIVMLEDNLEVASYRAMRDLATKHIGDVADFIRNPCVGCYEGNDDVLLGNAREEHTVSRFPILRGGDAFSLDGVGFQYPNSRGSSGVSASQLESLMMSAIDRKLRYFGLWRHAWQGVEEGISGFSQASTRNYVSSTSEELEYEIDVLRMGLLEEATEE
jgi:hypothetical protein